MSKGRGPATLDPADVPRYAADGVHVLVVPGGVGSRYERWEFPDGLVALVCYSSVHQLHMACGAGQPSRWVASPDIGRTCVSVGASAVVLDELLPVPPRYPEPDVRDLSDLDQMDEELSPLDFVYLPSRPVRAGDRRVDLELQPYRRQRALLVFTAPDALTAGCGPYQPWVSIPADRLPAVMAESGAECILFDPVLDEHTRHTGPVQDWR